MSICLPSIPSASLFPTKLPSVTIILALTLGYYFRVNNFAVVYAVLEFVHDAWRKKRQTRFYNFSFDAFLLHHPIPTLFTHHLSKLNTAPLNYFVEHQDLVYER